MHTNAKAYIMRRRLLEQVTADINEMAKTLMVSEDGSLIVFPDGSKLNFDGNTFTEIVETESA